jgi:hypothetical protein
MTWAPARQPRPVRIKPLPPQNWYAYRVQNWTLTAIHLVRTVKTWSTRERRRSGR